MAKNKHPFFVVVMGVIVLVGLFFLAAWIRFLYTPLITDVKGLEYTVPQGASLQSVNKDLRLRGIVTQPIFFDFLLTLKKHGRVLKAGEYFFQKGATPSKIIEQLMTGTGLAYRSFTILPGWRFSRLRAALDQQQTLQHTTQTLSDDEIMHQLGNSGLNPEAQFYPDTYFYVKNSSDLVLLKRAFQLMQIKFNAAWLKRDAGLYYQTPLEALTAASLIEKETSLDRERPVISGVLINRLRAGIPLQIDPTVIYAIGAQYTGVLHRSDLAFKSPYNTYVNIGLPPGPIAIPSMASIQAALHPAQHEYYYFVAINGEKDGHRFSKTLAEHNNAISAWKETRAKNSFFNAVLIQRYYLAAQNRMNKIKSSPLSS